MKKEIFAMRIQPYEGDGADDGKHPLPFTSAIMEAALERVDSSKRIHGLRIAGSFSAIFQS